MIFCECLGFSFSFTVITEVEIVFSTGVVFGPVFVVFSVNRL